MRSTTSVLLFSCLVSLALASPHNLGGRGESYNPPQQMHLAVTGDPTQMVVSWMTTLPTSDSVVQVSNSANSFFNSYTGEQASYLPSAGYVHHVLVTGLTPATKYDYICGSSDGGFTSQKATFKTPPVEGTRANHTFILYGDMGIFQYSYPTVKHVTQLVTNSNLDVDMVLQHGDMGYGNDRPDEFYEVSWNLFFYQMQIVMQQIPYMVAPGNHEEDCGGNNCHFYANNFTVYNYRYRMPGKESGSNTNMWFSWNYDNIHFVSISTETDYPRCPNPEDTFGDQLAWLEADLANASTNPNIDWIIVHGHQPIYSSVSGKSFLGVPVGDSRHVQQAFEDLFYQYHVDIYVDGHVHGYERSYPVYKSEVQGDNSLNSINNATATIYIVNGSAGVRYLFKFPS